MGLVIAVFTSKEALSYFSPRVPFFIAVVAAVSSVSGSLSGFNRATKEFRKSIEVRALNPPNEVRALNPPNDENIKVFVPQQGERYNRPFYEYFNQLIEGAKHNILITGDGFGYQGPEGEDLAEGFTSALRRALIRGVHVVRIQTKPDIHRKWVEALAGFCERKNFKLYVLRDTATAQLSSVCAIDPDLPEQCAVEVMLSTEQHFGTSAASLAGPAFVILRNQSLCKDLHNQIMTLANSDSSIKCSSPSEARRLLHVRSKDQTT